MTPDQHLAVSAVAGVWTAPLARAAGFSDDHVESRRQVEWQTLRRGTYAYAGVEPSPIMRAASAVLAAGGRLLPAAEEQVQRPAASLARKEATDDAEPGLHRCWAARAVAAGRTAARVWGIPLVDDEDPATHRFEAKHDDVLRCCGRSTSPTLHTCRGTLSKGGSAYVLGVPVLQPLPTLVHLASVLRPDALVAAIDHALHTSLVEEAALAVIAGDSRRGQRGAVALRAAVALADGRAESPHESLTRLLLKPLLPGLQPQVEVRDRQGALIARLDLGDRALKLGIESDGAAYHRGRAAADRRRDFRTGWTIERCSWFEIRCEQEQLRRRVLKTAAELAGRAA
jgi:hypothetical protein